MEGGRLHSVSLLKVLSSVLDTLDETISPAGAHRMMELVIQNKTNLLVDGKVQLLCGVESDPTEMSFDTGEKKKIRRGQVRRIRGVRDQLHVVVGEELTDTQGAVGGCPIVLEPKLIPSVPPNVPSFPAHCLPEAMKNCQVGLGIDRPTLRDELTMHDAT